MRRIIAILILVLFAILLYFYTDDLFSQNDKTHYEENKLTDENQILQMLHDDYDNVIALINTLQATPDQVINFNNMLTKKLYSGSVSEEDIEILLLAQRNLYCSKLLEKNPWDIHFERAKEEISSFYVNNVKVIGFDSLTPEFIGDKKENVITKVVFYLNNTSDKGEIYEEYLLIKEEELWYIKGWQKTEDFTIVGE